MSLNFHTVSKRQRISNVICKLNESSCPVALYSNSEHTYLYFTALMFESDFKTRFTGGKTSAVENDIFFMKSQCLVK